MGSHAMDPGRSARGLRQGGACYRAVRFGRLARFNSCHDKRTGRRAYAGTKTRLHHGGRAALRGGPAREA